MRIPMNSDLFKELESRYEATNDDSPMERIVVPVKQRGYLTFLDLEVTCRWKSPRALPLVRANTNDEVEAVTQWALSTPLERLRVMSLQLLSGVSWPMASVVLHWFHNDHYPILDVRAIWSLDIPETFTCSFKFWWKYFEQCRKLATELALPMRMVDRALWQFSKENGGPGAA